MGDVTVGGDGCRDGYGEVYGDGRGDGYGAAYGDGNGNGDGGDCGYVYSYGDGYGDGGNVDYWQSVLSSLIARLPSELRARAETLRARGATLAYWRSDNHGQPCNGGRGMMPAAPGVIHEIDGPLAIDKHGLHATLAPPTWKGEQCWLVALSGELQRDGNELAALRREIIARLK
jgi:hypothetical protein